MLDRLRGPLATLEGRGHARQFAEPFYRTRELLPPGAPATVDVIEEPHPAVPVDLDPPGAVRVDHEAVGVLVLDGEGEVRGPAGRLPGVAPLGPAQFREGRVEAGE